MELVNEYDIENVPRRVNQLIVVKVKNRKLRYAWNDYAVNGLLGQVGHRVAICAVPDVVHGQKCA